MLVASKNNGEIDGSEAGSAYLQRVAYLHKKPNFKPLIDCGFLECASECKQMLADARPEKRREETEKKASASRKTPIPKDFSISERVMQWAQEKGHHSLQAHFENFVGAAKAKGYTYVDWDDAFMNAIRSNWAKVPEKQERRVAL